MKILQYTTIVDPSEYDIEKDIEGAIDLANKGQGHPDAPHLFIPFDIGKIVGLYKAYKELKEKTG
jgi:hypothetical protein